MTTYPLFFVPENETEYKADCYGDQEPDCIIPRIPLIRLHCIVFVIDHTSELIAGVGYY